MSEAEKIFGQTYVIIGPADYVRYSGKHKFGGRDLNLIDSLEKYLDGKIKGASKYFHKKPKGTNPLNVWLREMSERGIQPTIRCIEVCYSLSELNSRETYWIAFYKERYPDLLNVMPGGVGGCGENFGMKGKIPWNKGLTKKSDERVAQYGKRISKVNKGKPSSRKGKTKENDEGVRKQAEKQKGRPFTEEHKKHLSENHANVSRENNPKWKPQIHIMETRECACNCGEIFECEARSKKRFLKNHSARGRKCSEIAKITKVNNEKIKSVLLDIAREEKTHVGELQALLLQVDSEQASELKKGAEEVEKV